MTTQDQERMAELTRNAITAVGELWKFLRGLAARADGGWGVQVRNSWGPLSQPVIQAEPGDPGGPPLPSPEALGAARPPCSCGDPADHNTVHRSPEPCYRRETVEVEESLPHPADEYRPSAGVRKYAEGQGHINCRCGASHVQGVVHRQKLPCYVPREGDPLYGDEGQPVKAEEPKEQTWRDKPPML